MRVDTRTDRGAWGPDAGRPRGIAIPLVLVLVLVIGFIGGFLIRLSRSAGRLSYWYHHGQMSFDVAQAGLREALLTLDAASRPGTGPPGLSPGCQTNLDAIVAVLVGNSPPTGQPMPLLRGDSENLGELTTAIAAVLDLLGDEPSYSPVLEVTVEALSSSALVPGAVQGILPLSRERLGGLKIVSSATVTPRASAAIPVTRTLVAYREYKVVNLLPPIFSRFPIFFGEAPPADRLNSLQIDFDTGNGDGIPVGPGKPLLLENRHSQPVHTGMDVVDVDWSAQLGPGFLDEQGWVFLGSGSGAGAAPWSLRLAHGYTGTGENFHLANERRKLAAPASLLTGIEGAFQSQLGCQATFDLTNASSPYGILGFTHGFARNYEHMGYLKPQQLLRGAQRIRFDLGPAVGSSALRLMGTADAAAPTLVMGDARRAYIRQGAYFLNFVTRCSGLFGNQELAIYLWDDPQGQASSRERTFVQAPYASQADYEKLGPGIIDTEPYLMSLFRILAPRHPGQVKQPGWVARSGGGGAGGPYTYQSQLLPALGSFQPPAAPDAAALDALRSGQVKIAGLFDGDLNAGLAAFATVMNKKLTRRWPVEVLLSRGIQGGTLKLPGIVLVEGGPLDLPAISAVAEGGVLMTQGDVEIGGDVVNAGPDPLTIVSLTGNVRVAPVARRVDAFLVALEGAVILAPGADVTIRGGIAGKKLDVEWAGTPGDRVVRFEPLFDPAAPGAETKFLRAYPLEDVQVMVGEGS